MKKNKKQFVKWNNINEVIPCDKQKIIIFDEGLQKELHRTFYLEFWQNNKRVLYCSAFCRKWKPRK